MASARQGWLPAFSEKVFQQLLFVYPRAYRDSYSTRMARTFGDSCYFAYQEGGVGGVLKLWVPTLLDLSATALEKHIEDGILSSRLAIVRVVSAAAILASGPLFVTEWEAGGGGIVLATVLFTGGSLGLLVSAPWTMRLIKERGSMSDSAIQPATEMRQPQARSTLWASGALVGLGVVDLIDIALDAISGDSYVQPMVDQYGILVVFLMGALPRLVVYLAGLWLFRKQSAWAVLPALLMAVPRAIFSDGVIRALLKGPRFSCATPWWTWPRWCSCWRCS